MDGLLCVKTADNKINLFSCLVLTVPSGPPFVSLEASPESVRGGDNVNLTCTVLGEPEVDVNFSWSYPGQVSKRSNGLIVMVYHHHQSAMSQ